METTNSALPRINPYKTPPRNPRPNTSPLAKDTNSISSPKDEHGKPFTLISALNLYQNRWTIRAMVVAKSDIKTWSNQRGDGSLFSIDLLDSSGCDIRATMFKEAVDKYYNLFVVGKVYTIRTGKLKLANPKWNTCKSKFEITLDCNSVIAVANEVQGDISSQSFHLVKIGKLHEAKPNDNVDVIGIVQDISATQSLTSTKTGQELKKTDLTIIDDTGCQVQLTLWGTQAININTAPDTMIHKVVAFRRARVCSFNGITLSNPQGIFIQPNISETNDLYEWWQSQGSRLQGSPVRSLTTLPVSMANFSDRTQLKDVLALSSRLHQPNQEKSQYFCFKGHLMLLKSDKEGGPWYCACPNTQDPCRNRYKVTKTDNNDWHCKKCDKTYPNCIHKWIFSGVVADDSGSSSLSIFDEQAITLLEGRSADDAFLLYEDEDAFNSVFEKAQYSEWIFKCQVRTKSVNQVPGFNVSLVKLLPLDYVKESQNILSQLEKWNVAKRKQTTT